MANFEEQFEDLENRLSDGFATGLKKAIKQPKPVSPAADEFIIGLAQKKLRRPGRFRIIRWAVPAASAAAAILLVAILNNQPKQALQPALVKETRVAGFAREDIDLNGQVNILDAMKLAKGLKQEQKINKEWDINNDGQVDSKDVDVVAYSAVRLDKGVM